MSYLPNDRLESALAVLVAAATDPLGLSVQVVTGVSVETKALPVVICSSSGDGEEDPHRSGNYWFNGMVQLRTKPFEDVSADPKTDRQTILDAIHSALSIGDLPAQLSASVSDFTCFFVEFQSPRSDRDDKGAWVDELPFRCYCCARGGLT